jgi:hypothetical protein
MPETATYGLIAEFHDADALVTAAKRTADAGYRKIDAFTPFPVHGLAEAIRFKDNRVQWLVLAAGIMGAIVGFGLQYWVHVIAYPLNAGGKPHLSWPAFIPVTFEMTILFAALAAVFGSFALNGLPEPYHPVFGAPRFALASRDRFFLLVEAADPKFDPRATRTFLEGLHAHEVTDVAH